MKEVSENKSSELLKAISENEETVISSLPIPQLDAKEPRLKITIAGPESLLKHLMDYLT